MFLLLHALELHLKAFLISQGMSDTQLRSVGHDLLACLRACKERGLASHVAIAWVDLLQIARLNVYYRRKELEYFVPKAKNFGSVDRLTGDCWSDCEGRLQPRNCRILPHCPGTELNPVDIEGQHMIEEKDVTTTAISDVFRAAFMDVQATDADSFKVKGLQFPFQLNVRVEPEHKLISFIDFNRLNRIGEADALVPCNEANKNLGPARFFLIQQTDCSLSLTTR
ncbi:MAG: hypothetical protein IPG91_02405 [Ideonella sp.]|nr:hypothetical protein [Ideonella sp.]